MTDAYRQPHAATVTEPETGETSGINIDNAKSRLLHEDEYDKQLYREKVKQKHRVLNFNLNILAQF